jgi:hypothetical protein
MSPNTSLRGVGSGSPTAECVTLDGAEETAYAASMTRTGSTMAF